MAPDLLGYGGTSKPLDVDSFRPSLISKDIIEILDAEKLDKVIPVGHDWGSRVASRLANYYPDRFLAFAFLAVAYTPPVIDFNIEASLGMTEQLVGYELFGYWLFFSEPDASKTISEHWDSFFSLLFPSDPKIWSTDFAPTGRAKAYIVADRKDPLPHYLTEQDKDTISKNLGRGDLASALNWYTVNTSGVVQNDDQSIPKDNYDIKQPVFLGTAKQDYICIADMAKATAAKHCKNLTVRDFDADHWLIFSVANEINPELLAWVESLHV